MKSFQIIYALTCIFFITSGTMTAQVNWVGGFPGQETNWDNPRSWSDNHVTGWDNVVLISNQSTRGDFYPVINSNIEPIAYLMIENGATLTVTNYGRTELSGKCRWGIFS